MNSRTFTSLEGFNLVVISSDKTFAFFMDGESKEHIFRLNFEADVFKELYEYIAHHARQAWSNLTPKYASSEGADYMEYYDKELDNNGGLGIRENYMFLERPSLESKRLYKFNKRKMEAFLYDFEELING